MMVTNRRQTNNSNHSNDRRLKKGNVRTHGASLNVDARRTTRRETRYTKVSQDVQNTQNLSGQKAPNFIKNIVDEWANRLLGAARDRTFSGQEEQYESNRASKDYIWNSVGAAVWGFVFPLLTIVITQLSGAEKAGMFSMAFVVAQMLMFLANFGVRTYQISDLNEKHSFADYQLNRVATCAIMFLVGVVYCNFRGYDSVMHTICVSLFFYKMIDGFADVYEGRLQQMNKLYLAGISQAIRSISVLVIFSICLLITGDLVVASISMAVVSTITCVVVTMPLTYFETPKSRGVNIQSVILLFKQCWPLFAAFFLYALIDTMPKFVMEVFLSYDNQLYFNALYFPAQGILITSQLIYKPMLVRMSEVWADGQRKRRFDLTTLIIVLIIIAITFVVSLVMLTIGIPIMSFLYGIDFGQYRALCLAMLVAGGVTAGIDFFYQLITLLRKQHDAIIAYLITFAFALFVPWLLVGLAGLAGAVSSYLFIMVILFVIDVVIYVRIRMTMRYNRRDKTDKTKEQSQ